MNEQIDIHPELRSIIALYKSASCLKILPRQGLLLEGAPLHPSDSVANHVFGVALVTYLVGHALQGAGHCVNVHRATAMAVIHDLGEAATGEIATGVKNWIDQLFPGQDVMEQVEHGLMVALIANVVARDEICVLLTEFDGGASIEAKIAKFADVFDAFAEAKEKLKTTFPAYLARQRQKLSTASDRNVQKAGQLLAGWLEALEVHWEEIEQERPWAKVKPNSQQGVAPNGGPATPLANSGVTEGPPSVS